MTNKQSPKLPEQAPSRGNKWWLIFAACILLIGGGIFYVETQFQPPKESGPAVDVEIPTGASPYEIGVMLQEKELIKNANFFKWYLAYEGTSSQLKAGKYYLQPGMTMEEIVHVLVDGDAKYGTTKFTVPEGLTIEQIADSLAEQKIVDKQAFLDEVQNGQFEYAFLKDIPQVEGMKHRLEGYLFPDTYETFQSATPHQVIDLMLKQTEQLLTPEWQEQMKKKNLTLHQTLTIASLIEREARVAKERPLIAGVIENRIKGNPPMKLQIDATVQYALGKTKELLLYEDLKVESPYNTYLIDGLPPGPISTSGQDAVRAALFPEEHNYFFYVTKNDGSGEHYFATTFAEHQQNIAKSQ
ncbi:endolytic transglycosylase MltG [Tumebacillus lipolyticus]|uniref:Endolytic murein transglycosylase n=1 Tax=Tumebacillus lipolyticus TaxID=1280370 RepID=A0ABW4ZUF0_9BACL